MLEEAAQQRARRRCCGCTPGRVGGFIIGNLYRFELLGFLIALTVLFSLKVPARTLDAASGACRWQFVSRPTMQ